MMVLDGSGEGVHAVGRCRLRRGAAQWPFEVQNRAAIDAHWRRRHQETPQFFNGRVHIMIAGTIRDGGLEGTLVETDFASSLFWRETGYSDRSVADCFGSALLVSADGWLIYGRQAPGNINANLTYPPGGFIDRRDIDHDGVVDLDGSIMREIVEETGLAPGSLRRDPGYLVTRDGPLLSVGIVYRSSKPGVALLDEINQRLGTEDKPELEAVVGLRRPSQTTDHAMPGYARHLAHWLLSGQP